MQLDLLLTGALSGLFPGAQRGDSGISHTSPYRIIGHMGSRSKDPLRRDALASTQLARMPLALADRGLCARHPEPGLWSADTLAERKRAAAICQRCPVLGLCAAYAASLPASHRSGVIYAGVMTSSRNYGLGLQAAG